MTTHHLTGEPPHSPSFHPPGGGEHSGSVEGAAAPEVIDDAAPDALESSLTLEELKAAAHINCTDVSLIERLRGRTVLASVSAGKDSAAMCLYLKEQGISFIAVHQRTGWDAERMGFYEYMRGELTRVIGPIIEIQGPRLMSDLVRHKGMFPSRKRRVCTEGLKIEPMQKYLRELADQGLDVVNAIGIRADESADRATALEWDFSPMLDCDVWRPILTWSIDDVVAIHKRHGLAPNPLYLLGATRVGCWPCINATKAEIKLVADKDPQRIGELRALEAEVGAAAMMRYERDRAKWLEEPPPEPTVGSKKHATWTRKRARLMSPFVAPAFFQAKLEDPPGSGLYPCWPIDKVVEWSRTSRGGRQFGFELFTADPGEAGCMRWGLCETSAPKAETAT